MNNKKFIYIGGALILALFAMSLYFAFRKKPETQVQPPPGPTVSIPTQNGSVIVSDPAQNPVEQVGDAAAIAETGQYDIVYYKSEQSFVITLLSQPLQAARDAAEDAFLAKLNIGKGDACKLNVSLAVPLSVDSANAGQNFGLSFCPGSAALQ